MRALVVVLGAILTMGMAHAQPAAVDLAAVTVRDAADNRLTLNERIATPTILHFWATWCAPCREELPELAAFDAVLDEQGLAERLVLVSIDTIDFAAITAFLDDLALEIDTLQQIKGNAGSAFGILAYPATVVVDGDGAVLFHRQGVVAWDDPEVAQDMVGLID
ncbi:TlpA disulfide reductase family protein [Pelagibacterium montanilacus]|uniref:TlpA disulfide reductase family protein n=1 Tax=Pelagibacterium montanilacus TaxID=2185280 RepID=UPI0013DEC4A5|nr:TlpA disulfide reductase family protein [Pelagibacterium montanilacus]